MKTARAIGFVAVTLMMLCGVTAAQQNSAGCDNSRQLLDEAWWTGPMLAPSASTLPRGHFLLEPYVYDVIVNGHFNRAGERHSAPHANDFGSLTYALYGITDRLTAGIIPTLGLNTVTQGLSSSGIGMGDVTLQAQYRLRQFHEGSWLPTISVAAQETLPTGKYDRLGSRPSDAYGSGAHTTTLSLYTQTYAWLPNGRILRMRFNFSQSFSSDVNVRDASVYGTNAGFRGSASPGPSSYVDGSFEYSLRKRFVLALDVTYLRTGNTSVQGYNWLDHKANRFDLGASDAFGLAPAIEYSWSSRLGVLLGTRIIPAGHNTAATVTPAIAINYVH